METGSSSGSNKHVLIMAFGLPVLTTAIVVGSMYAGHVLTTRSDRPTNVLVNSAAPKIDVNVPQAAPPPIINELTAPPAAVNVQLPQQPAPQVTVNTPPIPPMPAPNITVNPAPPTVTIIEREKESRVAEKPAPAAAAEKADPKLLAQSPAANEVKAEPKVENTTEPRKDAAPAVKPSTDALKPVENATKPGESKQTFEDRIIPSAILAQAHEANPVLVSVASAATGTTEQLTLETLYACATRYIETYCQKNNLDPEHEARRWNRAWKANVDQAISDNIDSNEQSYINRIVIAKRDYFNIEKATPEKVVEACRILLRYRDGRLEWLSAMKEALTQDNLKKTVAFLAAGPK